MTARVFLVHPDLQLKYMLQTKYQPRMPTQPEKHPNRQLSINSFIQYRAFLFSLSQAPQLSQDIPADVSFLCIKAAVLRAGKKERKKRRKKEERKKRERETLHVT